MHIRRRQTMFALAMLASPLRGLGANAVPVAAATPADADCWTAYARALAAQLQMGGGCGAFKSSSGLSIADWEIINYTGLSGSGTPGTPIYENIYQWADTMPDYSSASYLPGNSWYSQYSAFINALKASSRDKRVLDGASSQLALDRMGTQWPAYRITPGLNDFLLASLQSMINKQPQLQFSAELNVGGSCAQLEFSAQSAQVFRAEPGRWFDSAMIAGYSDRIDPASALANKPLFGPDGMLNLRTTQILVAVQRKLTLHLPPPQLDRCAALATQGGDGALRLAGVCFDRAHTDVSTCGGSLTLCDNTNAPYVLGATAAVYGAGVMRCNRR
jgi:hypothetical protein